MRFDDILFLEVDDVLEAHAIGIARFGGSSGLRDPGLLDSAVMAARSGSYGSLAELAAVYAHGIAKNHLIARVRIGTALVATHDRELVGSLDARVVQMSDGRLAPAQERTLAVP
jgi:death-on-curing protein